MQIRIASVLVVFLLPPAALAQHTPWGDPDFQGVWSNQTPVPLERPAALADKPLFSAQEAAEVEKRALGRFLELVTDSIPTSGEFNEIWLEVQKGKVGRNLSTSLVVDPPDGRIPYTVEGRARWDATPSLEGEISSGSPLDANEPRDRTLAERCITTGGLFIPNPFYNNYHRIVQAPGYIVIATEMMHEARIIPLDGRPLLGPAIRQWLGDSRGRWDGPTLLVETTNFNDKRLFRGATSHLRLLERFTRVDEQTLAYRLTVTDPSTFSRPWSIENDLWRTDERLYEVACHEGNYGLANILSAARAAETR